MSAYMQNKFVFAGIPKPKLKELIKPLVHETVKEQLDWNLVLELWKCEQREAQYIALEYPCPMDLWTASYRCNDTILY